MRAILLLLLAAVPAFAQVGGQAPFRIAEEGTTLAARPVLNFVGTTVTCAVDGARITCTFTGGSAGHEIQDEGVAQTARAALNFIGTAIECVDNAGADSTDCTVTGGSGVDDATYWVGAAHAGLSAEINLGALSTGLVINTAGTPSAYGGAACTNQFIEDLSASGAPTCQSVDLANDITGTLAIANGGTGQTGQTAAFDALAPTTTLGDLILYGDSGDNERFAASGIGKFLRTNPTVADGLEWSIGPNVGVMAADTTNSSNVTPSFLTAAGALLAVADSWVALECVFAYESDAATTTGIAFGLFVNDGTASAAPQYLAAHVSIHGLAADGTDSTWEGEITTETTDLVISTGVVAINTPYLATMKVILLTHATEVDAAAIPIFRSEVNTSQVTVKEGSYCLTYGLRAD